MKTTNNPVKDVRIRMNRPTLLNADEAAAFVNVSRRGIHAWLRKRNIFFFTVDDGGEGDILVAPSDIRAQLRKPRKLRNKTLKRTVSTRR